MTIIGCAGYGSFSRLSVLEAEPDSRGLDPGICGPVLRLAAAGMPVSSTGMTDWIETGRRLRDR